MARAAVIWISERRVLIWIDHSPHVGSDMRGPHPMVVLSPKAFNDKTSLVIGLPMTHSPMNETNPFAVKFTGSEREVCYVLAHQPKSFDWRTRGAAKHPWGRLDETLFDAACERLNAIISLG